MKKIFSFLSYHNAVPIAGIVLALGAGATFAMSTGVLPLPQIAISAPPRVDATALLNADLGGFAFNPTVTAVDENGTTYTVSYSMQTLAPENGAWTTVSKTGEFSVGEDALGGGLNAYVVQKLTDIENQELSYLEKAQADERAIAQGSGSDDSGTASFPSLVGLALGQIPVPVAVAPTAQSASVVQNPTPQTAEDSQATESSQSTMSSDMSEASSTPAVTEATSSADTAASATPNTPPVLQVNGDNPASVQVGDTYTDLGATITGPTADLNLGITTYVNGIEMNPVQIVTTEAATDTIDYVATLPAQAGDQNGLTSTSTRTVIVEVSTAADNSTATTTSSATDTATSTPSAGVDATITSDAQNDSGQASATTTDATSTTGE